MKNVQEIERMFLVANNIQQGFNKIDTVYTTDTNCDKKGWGFNLDSRFSACEGVNLYVSSWKGYYGNSGCSNIFDLDKSIFNKHLLKVLQGKFRSIMEETADSIMKEAATLKEEAKKELEAKLESINKL